MPAQITSATLKSLEEQEIKIQKLEAVMAAQKDAGFTDPHLEGLIKQAKYLLKSARTTIEQTTGTK